MQVLIMKLKLYHFFQRFSNIQKKHDLLFVGPNTEHEHPIKYNTCLSVVARQYKKNIFNFFWMYMNYD